MQSISIQGHIHHLCGGRYQNSSESVTIRVSGMSTTVDRVVLRCSKCEHEERTADHREDAERVAWLAIRKTHGLLTPKEIRLLRESLGITHEQMGDLLYGTPKGIVEGWERGRYLQNQQVDEMLRSLEDRQTVERLAAKAGVVVAGTRNQEPGSRNQGPGTRNQGPVSEAIAISEQEVLPVPWFLVPGSWSLGSSEEKR
ncbi:MAG: hypothetical protein H7Z74_03040 [Anaerolineae bacterium]|nr:hypothetical protein [Gemmatimonadaceae bacterium]